MTRGPAARMRHVGVDGCRTGWVAVTRAGSGLVHSLHRDIGDLVRAFPDAERIFVDVPIGLPWAAAPVRECDRLARTVLGTRRSSVFPVPCRPAAHARTVEEARAKNLETLGHSLAAQTWGICGKIAEVDRLLHGRPGLPMREVHPEVCLWALAGGREMAHNKKTRAGAEERLDVLTRYEAGARTFVAQALAESWRSQVQADDIVDALAALVTAERGAGSLARLPAEPGHDERGLPMEMMHPAVA